MQRLRRLTTARVVRVRDAIIVVHPNGVASRLEGDSAALAEAVLAHFDAPRTAVEIVDHVRALADGPFDDRVVTDLLKLLERAGVLGVDSPSVAISPCRIRVVLCVTGAIQAVEAPRLVLLLQRRGMEVRIAATASAERFVSFSALEAITHAPVQASLWGGTDKPAAHIDLATWADLVVVYPASATTIARVAQGDFSSVVSATAIATRAPVVLAPSMNGEMLAAAAVERNLATLKDDGFFIVSPSFGVEVADAPEARVARYGPAPSPERIEEILIVLARSLGLAQPDWERIYADGAATLPWSCDEVPADLAEVLAELAPPKTLLDVGTGLGTLALHASERGYQVVATDIASRALARAAARKGSERVVFLRDDVTDTRLANAFDIVVDRGCMHGLRARDLPSYFRAITRLVRENGALVVVADGKDAPTDRGTLRFTPEELAQRLEGFSLVRSARTTLSADAPDTAWLTVWTHRAP